MTATGPALLRRIHLGGAISLVISNSVGVGILTSSGYLARDLGEPILFLAIWVVGGLLALIGALCYSELGMNFPASGGEYVYLHHAYGPVWGFMTGWTSFLAGFAAPVAAAALAFAEYLGTFFPAFRPESALWNSGTGLFSLHLGGAQILACGIIGALTVANLYGVQRATRLQQILTGLKLGVLLLFLFFAIVAGNGNLANFSLSTFREGTTPLPAQFAVSLYFVYVSYSGWNAATYIAEEIADPARNVPKALLAGTAIVTALYLSLNAVFLYAVPLGVMKGFTAVGALASARLFGPQMASAFSILMAMILLGTLNAMITVGPRVVYAMARNGAFFPAAAQVDPQWRAPVPALLLLALVSMALTFTSLPSLFFFIGFTLNFFSMLSVVALFRFRRRPGWRKLPLLTKTWPLLPGIFILTGAWMTLFGFTLEPRISFTATALIAAGALYYRHQLQSRKAETPWDASSTAN
ncbi:MAG: amino acid permease [Bryobacter sp.]|nr:amino acid permease [Bryobacter sp.]